MFSFATTILNHERSFDLLQFDKETDKSNGDKTRDVNNAN